MMYHAPIQLGSSTQDTVENSTLEEVDISYSFFLQALILVYQSEALSNK